MAKLTKEQIKEISKILNPYIDVPKVPEFLEGIILRLLISIIDLWFFKIMAEDIYEIYKGLMLMLIETGDQDVIDEVLAFVPDNYKKMV